MLYSFFKQYTTIIRGHSADDDPYHANDGVDSGRSACTFGWRTAGFPAVYPHLCGSLFSDDPPPDETSERTTEDDFRIEAG